MGLASCAPAARCALSWRFPGQGRSEESDAHDFTYTVEMRRRDAVYGMTDADCIGDIQLSYIGDPARHLHRGSTSPSSPGPTQPTDALDAGIAPSTERCLQLSLTLRTAQADWGVCVIENCPPDEDSHW